MKSAPESVIKLSRRGLIRGLGVSLIAAPAIVRAASLMPVKAMPQATWRQVHDGSLLLDAYGRSPAMDALADMEEINRRVERYLYRDLYRAIGALPMLPYKEEQLLLFKNEDHLALV